MKRKATRWIVAVGLAVPFAALAQKPATAVADEAAAGRGQAGKTRVGVIGEDRPQARVGVIGEDRPQAVRTGTAGTTLTPGTQGYTPEKLPGKIDPKGPDKLGASGAAARLGQVAMDPKEKEPPPKDEPKDPKGPDKLGTALQREAAVGIRPADRALPAQSRAGQQATRAAGQATRP